MRHPFRVGVTSRFGVRTPDRQVLWRQARRKNVEPARSTESIAVTRSPILLASAVLVLFAFQANGGLQEDTIAAADALFRLGKFPEAEKLYAKAATDGAINYH